MLWISGQSPGELSQTLGLEFPLMMLDCSSPSGMTFYRIEAGRKRHVGRGHLHSGSTDTRQGDSLPARGNGEKPVPNHTR